MDLCYSVPFKIRDLVFYPENIYRFVSCGLQHMTKWQYNGKILEFQAMDEDGRLFDVLSLDKRDGRRSVARAARNGVEIAPRTPTWRDAPAD